VIGGKGDTEIREYQLTQPKAPCRVYRPDPETGELVLIAEDFKPKPPKIGKAKYRDSMIRSHFTFGGE
jgi:hypothetical protein